MKNRERLKLIFLAVFILILFGFRLFFNGYDSTQSTKLTLGETQLNGANNQIQFSKVLSETDKKNINVEPPLQFNTLKSFNNN